MSVYAEGSVPSEVGRSMSETAPIYLSLPPSSTIGGIEALVDRVFCEHGGRSIEHLLLDMRECSFIEVSALIYLISLTTSRERAGLRTSIALPRSKSVRDFMRVWRFPEGMREATSRLFSQLVIESDRIYFGENVSFSDLRYAGTNLLGGLERLVSERFFSLAHLPLSGGHSKNIVVVKKESARWDQRLIMTVLEKYLNGPKGYISSRVVYESMTNAVRHPNARFIQTASHLSEGRGGRFFTIVFWDDGDSIVDTLRRALTEGKEIRSREVPSSDYKFWVRLQRPGQREESRIVSSDFSPDSSTEDSLLLLSSVFPGITRDPAGREHSVHESLSEDPELSRPGMGLFMLINTAVDVFGGSVAFRTHHQFMNIKRISAEKAAEVGAGYQAKISQFAPSFPKFLGNLITVRLPLEARARD